MKKRKNNKSILSFILLIIVILIYNNIGSYNSTLQNSDSDYNGISVHYIDIGQGDCELIIDNGKTMLIDGGETIEGKKVVAYLKSRGITKLDYIVGTHPHTDHIGGLIDVINSIPVDNIILPKVTGTTKTFENFIVAIKKNNINVINPNPMDTFTLNTALFTCLAPNNKSYLELNNYSVVLKMDYNNVSFLFTGDAESLSEKEMLSKNFNLKADVLKVGHHGSNTSTSLNFLKAVNPKVAIISCGKDNVYNFPKPNTLKKLNTIKSKIYRTDLSGTIVVKTDGSKLEVITEK